MPEYGEKYYVLSEETYGILAEVEGLEEFLSNFSGPVAGYWFASEDLDIDFEIFDYVGDNDLFLANYLLSTQWTAVAD